MISNCATTKCFQQSPIMISGAPNWGERQELQSFSLKRLGFTALLNYDVINHILQFNNREFYMHGTKSILRFTKQYISRHCLNKLKRVKVFTDLQKLKAQLDSKLKLYNELISKKDIDVVLGKKVLHYTRRIFRHFYHLYKRHSGHIFLNKVGNIAYYLFIYDDVKCIAFFDKSISKQTAFKL